MSKQDPQPFNLGNALRGCGVKRYHTMLTIRQQTVADHSARVALLLHHVAPHCRAEVLLAALMHDLSEFATGDTPSPSKWRWPDLQDALRKAEQAVEHDNGFTVRLTNDERHLVSWCDMMELITWGDEEAQLGNTHAVALVKRGLASLRQMGHPNFVARDLFNMYHQKYDY